MMSLNDPLECVAEWSKRFAAHDSVGLSELYHEQAFLYGSAENVVTGRDAIRGYFAAIPPEGTASAEFSDLLVRETSATTRNLAGFVDFTVGESGISMRISLAFVRQGANWLIGLHHASPRGAITLDRK